MHQHSGVWASVGGANQDPSCTKRTVWGSKPGLAGGVVSRLGGLAEVRGGLGQITRDASGELSCTGKVVVRAHSWNSEG